MMDLPGNLQTTPGASHPFTSEVVLSVCGFQPWGSQSEEDWLLLDSVKKKINLIFMCVFDHNYESVLIV